ncbi:MAG: hypothetical protein HY655_02095 [Acidobacteria bacterium]|nr:hypothetical protein [Acidobacteriota bacterium]
MTTPPSVTAVTADDRRDRRLIKLLLAHLEQTRGQHWTSLDFPEERIRTRDAVQIIAMEQSGRVTAVEHIPLDGFAADTRTLQFLTALSPLERDPSLHVPGIYVDLSVAIDMAPAAVDWKLLANSVRGWCTRHIAAVAQGHTSHVIMVSRTALKIHVEKTACPGEPGRLSIIPEDPPRNFEAVIHDRLQHKLARVAAASADRRVMLFERREALWSAGQLRLELDGARLEFPELNAVNEIWMADTVAWESEGYLAFRRVFLNEEE